MHFCAARETASEVTVAPETASSAAVWPAMRRFLSSAAAAWPMPGVSADASITTSVMRLASKLIVTKTSPAMPAALAV